MSSTIAAFARRNLINATVSCLCTVAGGALLFGAGAYRVFISPHLAAAAAADLLWPFFAAGAMGVAAGWWLDRMQD